MAGLDLLRKKVSALSTRSDAPAILQPLPVNTTDTAMTDTNYSAGLGSWGVSSDRIRKWNELDEIDRTDEIAARALDIIADCATGYEPTQDDSFTWRFKTKRPGAALEILKRADDRLLLKSSAHQIVRSFVKFGEESREIVFGGDDDTVVRFKHLRSCYIWPNLDANGNRIAGYEQRRENQKVGAGIQLADWQVVRFLYSSEDDLYGRGLFEPARSTFNRLRKVEDGMVIARVFRAYDRLKHKVPVPSGSTTEKQLQIINSYKDTMSKRRVMGADGVQRQRNRPLDIPTDIYLADDGSNRGDVESIVSQNVQLQHIDDVKYLQQRLLVAAKVPRTYLNMGTGNEGSLTDSGTGTEDMQFARCLRQIQAILRHGMLELGSTILWLQGQDPVRLGLSIDMPRVNTENFLQESKVRLNDAQAALIFTKILGSLPPELVASEFMSLGDADKESLVSSLRPRSAPETGDITVDAVVQSIFSLKRGVESTMGITSIDGYDSIEEKRAIKDTILDVLCRS